MPAKENSRMQSGRHLSELSRPWDSATGTQIGPTMKHDGSVRGASFTKDEGRILSWSTDKTLQLRDSSWRGENLFEIACNYMPQSHDLARLSDRYGVQIAEPICKPDKKMPDPDWSKVEAAPQGNERCFGRCALRIAPLRVGP